MTASCTSSRRLLFPKSSRLLKRSDFKRTMRTTWKVVDLRLVVLAMPKKDSSTRLGIVASKKVGKAVHRNRAKRLIRESFRKLSNKPAGMDFVVIVRSGLLGASQQQTQKSLDACLARLLRKMQSSVIK